jgi:hypothetical protein
MNTPGGRFSPAGFVARRCESPSIDHSSSAFEPASQAREARMLDRATPRGRAYGQKASIDAFQPQPTILERFICYCI